MKINKTALIVLAIAVCMPAYPAFAATENSVSAIVTPARDMDFSSNIAEAPFLTIKTDMDLPLGAVFVVSLSPGAKWAYDDANMSSYFSGASGAYTSTQRLSDEQNFEYSARILTETDMQITANAPLSRDKYMLVPLVVKLDGSAEASVSVSSGESYGISSGTYVFANPGRVNEATIKITASSETSGDIITGSVSMSFSAGLGDGTVELLLPAGFNFGDDYKNTVVLTGDGGYSSVNISEIWLNSTNSTMFIKTAGSRLTTAPSALKISGIKLTALDNAPEGDITVSFTGFNANERFKFGEYSAGQNSVEEPQETPEGGTLEINASATSGSTQAIVNGETFELDAAPYNDENGRLLVPLRFVADGFGVGNDNIYWDAQTKQASVVLTNPPPERKVVFTIDSSVYTVAGEEKTMDTAAVIKDGYTFIPARYLAEAFGISVNYMPETKTAEFTGNFEW